MHLCIMTVWPKYNVACIHNIWSSKFKFILYSVYVCTNKIMCIVLFTVSTSIFFGLNAKLPAANLIPKWPNFLLTEKVKLKCVCGSGMYVYV